MVLHLLFVPPTLQRTIVGNVNSHQLLDLYTSASVILAARLCSTLEQELDYHSMQISWKRCVEILRGLEHHYDAARRCLATLEAIHEQIIAPQMMPRLGDNDAQVQDNGNITMGQNGAVDMRQQQQQSIDGVVMPNQDPLLQYNTDHPWGTKDMDFGWFFENPMWNSPDFTGGS